MTKDLLRALMKIAHYSPASKIQPVLIARDALIKAIGTWRQGELDEPIPSGTVERHPGPWVGTDADLARACAMAAIECYGSDDPETHQRIMTEGVWNDHVAVQAALTAIHNLRKGAYHETVKKIAAVREKRLADTLTALRKLVFAARTSGGTAGRDAGICAACDEAEAIIEGRK